MQMDYFRRPALAGNNISRPTFAFIRGSVRRADADGFVAFPYFAGANLGQTINVKIDGVTYPVTITVSNGITDVLTDINTAIGSNGLALDADGTIQIQTATAGANGSVEVTGGTAAAALGFDVSLGKIRSVGGDIPSSPEGRVGNAFGVGFLNKSENFTQESVVRGMARLAANADVLFSEHMRGDALPKKIAYTTSDGKTLTPTSADSVRVFTGFGHLSASTAKEALAPFFFLIDQATGLPPASRVVGIVRGSPAGLPPYANATAWVGGGATGNVLGVDLDKVTASTITDIKNGRVIYASGADFVTAKVVPGDFVSITTATNLTPWSNNGYRWVVEEVIDATHIAVRPMSSSELAQMGTSSTEEQPILELNTKKTGPEIYGAVTVRTGTYTNDVRIIADPPIPSGATYDLYVASPGDIRSRKTYEPSAATSLARQMASDLRPEPNMLLVAPTVSSWSATQVVLTGGYARFSGRVVSIPAKTILAADFSNLSLNYVYWDKDKNDVYVTRSHVKVLNSDPTQSPGSAFPADTQASQHLIAEVVKSGSNITSVIYDGRVVAEEAEARVITVGAGGEFAKLEDAVHFVNRWYKGNGQRSDTYPQFEIVIVADTTVDFATITNPPDYGPNSIFIDCPVKIRGARPGVILKIKNYTAGTPFDFGWSSGGGTYIIEDLFIQLQDASFNAVSLFFGRSGTTCIFRNVTVGGGIGGYSRFGFFSSQKVVIDGCLMADMRDGFLDASANTVVEVSSCNLFFTLVNSGPSVFNSAALTAFTGKRLTVRDCIFNNLQTDQGYSGVPLMGNFGHFASFENCSFLGAVGSPGVDSLLFKQQYIDGPLYIRNCFSNTPTRCFIDSTNTQENYCNVDSCFIYVAPDAGNPGIRCGSITNSTIFGQGGTSPTLIDALRQVSGNFLFGSSAIGIRFNPQNQNPYSSTISNNRIEVSGGVSILATTFDGWNNSGVSVTDNQILVAGTGAIGIKCWSGTDQLYNGTLSGNQIRIKTGDGVNSKIGIHVRGNPNIIGNQIMNVFGDAVVTSGHIGIKIDAANASPKIIGNLISIATGNYTCVSIEGGSPAAILMANHLYSNGTALSFSSPSNVFACEVVGNNINGVTSAVSSLAAGKFNDNYVQGPVTGANPGLGSEIQGNYFTGVVTLFGTAARGLRTSNNYFLNAVTITNGYMDLVQNRFDGNVTAASNTRFFENQFPGANTFLFSGSFVVDANVFEGNGATISFGGYPGHITNNRFVGNSLTSLSVGGTSEEGYQHFFTGNYCTCSTNLLADYTMTLVVDGNYLGGVNNFTEVDSFNNNYLGIAGTSSLTGRRGNGALEGKAPAVGNVIVGAGAWTFFGMMFSGCEIRTTAGTLGFNNCEFGQCDINTSGTTYTNCRMADCYFPAGGFLTVAGGSGGGLSMTGCRSESFLSVTVSTSGTEFALTSSRVSGNLTIGSIAGQFIDLESTHCTGSLTLTSGGGLRMNGLSVDGNGTISCSNIEGAASRFQGTCSITTTGNVNISSSILGTSTSSITASGGYISGCYMGTATLVLGTGSGAGVVSASRLAGGSLASGTVTGCQVSGDFSIGVNNVTYAFSSLNFTNNVWFGNTISINPYVDTVYNTQRVIFTGNTVTPNVITPSGPISGLDVLRGRGVVISGNSIKGPGTCVRVGTAAQATDVIICDNYFIGQTGDYSWTGYTFTATASGSSGLLSAGTYSYIALWTMKLSVGEGHVNNRPLFSFAIRTNNATVGANGSIDLALNPYFAGSFSGLTFHSFELYRTGDAGATWRYLSSGSSSLPFLFGNYNEFGETGVLQTPSLIPSVSGIINNTNDRPVVHMIDSYRCRIMNNLMEKASVIGQDRVFIVTSGNAKGTLIGDNHFTDVATGECDDANTGTNEDDTYWTANPTTTYSAGGSVASGGTRRP